MAEIVENVNNPGVRYGPAESTDLIVEEKNKLHKAITEEGQKLRKFTLQDVETCLGVLVITGGNYKHTSQQVKEEFGIDVHPVTIKKWATYQFPSKYAEIQAALSDNVSDIVKGRMGDLTLRSTEIQGKMLDKLNEQLDIDEDLSIKDLAPAIRNLAQTTQMNVQLRQLLEDKPTQITEARTIEKTIAELEGNEIIIDAEVEEED